jgi:hypothetical protein
VKKILIVLFLLAVLSCSRENPYNYKLKVYIGTDWTGDIYYVELVEKDGNIIKGFDKEGNLILEYIKRDKDKVIITEALKK